MSRHREGELGAVPFRSGRFFYIDEKWYFSCREGKDQGPFNSKHDAEMALAVYIDKILRRAQSGYRNVQADYSPNSTQ